MTRDDVVDNELCHRREDDDHESAQDRATERARRHPGIAFEVCEDAPDGFHAGEQGPWSTERAQAPRSLLRRSRLTKFERVIIEQIFISPGHNYFGHYGQAPGESPFRETPEIECVAGRGIRGDRFFDYKDDYKGQVTFFAREVFDDLSLELGLTTKSPGVLRRNIIVSGIDLNELIGAEFELQGVQFYGSAHCKPCDWMNLAFAPGAEPFLRPGKGGLRARILTDGKLCLGEAQLKLRQIA